jgi:hypothetical protein
LFFEFCFCFSTFCFCPFSLSFLPPLSPIACLLSSLILSYLSLRVPTCCQLRFPLLIA